MLFQDARPVPLEQINAPTVNTELAAYYLGRKPGTLRGWACYGKGDIQPQRINGRLAWSVADIRKLLGVKPAATEFMQGRGAA